MRHNKTLQLTLDPATASAFAEIAVGHNPDEEFFWAHDPFRVSQGATDFYDNTKSRAFDKFSYKLMLKIWNCGPENTG